MLLAVEPEQAALKGGTKEAQKSAQSGWREALAGAKQSLPIIAHIDLHVLIRGVCVRSALVNSLYNYNQILQLIDIH